MWEFIVAFELLFLGGLSVDVANCDFLISVFMEYIYKKTFQIYDLHKSFRLSVYFF